MWIYDTETHAILAANAAAVSRYGYSREEFLALTTADIVAPDESPEADGPVSGVSHHLRKDGREIKVRMIAHAVAFDGRPANCVVAEDVGERERLESQLRQAQKMEAVGQLAGGSRTTSTTCSPSILGYARAWPRRPRRRSARGASDLDEIERRRERAAA